MTQHVYIKSIVIFFFAFTLMKEHELTNQNQQFSNLPVIKNEIVIKKHQEGCQPFNSQNLIVISPL